jgi:hypothetical protein
MERRAIPAPAGLQKSRFVQAGRVNCGQDAIVADNAGLIPMICYRITPVQ